MGMLEDLHDEVSTLRKTVVMLCARAGHGEWGAAYPTCAPHRHTKREGWDESCTTCGEFRCCAGADGHV